MSLTSVAIYDYVFQMASFLQVFLTKIVNAFWSLALYPRKLAITSPTSGGRSVGIVRSRTQTMEFFLVSPMRATRLGHRIVFVCIILTMRGEKCKAWSFRVQFVPASCYTESPYFPVLRLCVRGQVLSACRTDSIPCARVN
jgi:hypothetical protein